MKKTQANVYWKCSMRCVTWVSHYDCSFVEIQGLRRNPCYNLFLNSTLKHWALGLPWWSSHEDTALQCKGHWFHPWFRKIPHASEQLSPCATTAEARAPRACASQKEKPPQWEVCAPQLQSSSCSLQLEKSPHSSEDPAQPKISK